MKNAVASPLVCIFCCPLQSNSLFSHS